MFPSRAVCVLAFALSFSSLPAQTGITIAGAGYMAPTPIRVAPGQDVTLFVTGLQTVLPNDGAALRASTLPLPFSLAGISVSIQQPFPGGFTGPIPLFAVQQFNQCSSATGSVSADCLMTAVSAQIPYEVVALNPAIDSPFLRPTNLVVSEMTGASTSFAVFPVPVNAHILTACDTILGSSGAACDPLITHADGSPVTPSAPAAAGENLVLYAVGLGSVSGPVTSGAPSPSAAPSIATQIQLTLAYVLQGIMSSASLIAPQTAIQFAGLTPGQVGLYQINFQLTATPALANCAGGIDGSSNVIVSLEESSGLLDRAGFCAATGSTSAGR